MRRGFALGMGLIWSVNCVSALAAGYAIDPASLRLDPPPAAGSVQANQDLQAVHEYENTRTRAQCREADDQSAAQPRELFGSVLTADEMAKVEKLGQDLRATTVDAVDPFKERYQRPRPYDADRSLRPCIRLPGGSKSYPSGHAAIGVILGAVFAEVFPDKQAALLEQGLHVGQLRILGGVHYPSDVAAGQTLGAEVLSELKKNADFQRDLMRLKSR